MKANSSSFHQNYGAEKKPADIVEKDIRKWVESVVEFKSSLDKQKNEVPLEKHLVRKVKKLKVKKKPSSVAVSGGKVKNGTSGQRHKNVKTKKTVKNPGPSTAEKSRAKDSSAQPVHPFDEIKESYRNLKLPQNWTSGVSGGRVVFNRIKVTTQNCQQKMAVERSLVITKDCNVHVLINGSEITLNNWETQKVDTMDDIKRAIKDIDSLKICEGLPNGQKSPQCSKLVDSKLKICQACKSETSPQKTPVKKPRNIKKQGASKAMAKQKSFQN